MTTETNNEVIESQRNKLQQHLLKKPTMTPSLTRTVEFALTVAPEQMQPQTNASNKWPNGQNRRFPPRSCTHVARQNVRFTSQMEALNDRR